jgi:hypothetical protein
MHSKLSSKTRIAMMAESDELEGHLEIKQEMLAQMDDDDLKEMAW